MSFPSSYLVDNCKTIYRTLFILILLLGTSTIYLHNNSVGASNVEIPPNELGTNIKECAQKYCPQLDGLGLWMEIQPVCHPMVTVADKEKVNTLKKKRGTNRSKRRKLQSSDSMKYIKASHTGYICAIASLASMLLGFVAGKWLKAVDPQVPIALENNSWLSGSPIKNKHEYEFVDQSNYKETDWNFYTDDDMR